MPITTRPDASRSARWSFRGPGGRFVARAAVERQLAERAASALLAGAGLAPWPAAHASANVADVRADARGFFDVADPSPRPIRAARTRALAASRAWGLDRS